MAGDPAETEVVWQTNVAWFIWRIPKAEVRVT